MGFAVLARNGREYQFRVAGANAADAERIFTMDIAVANLPSGPLEGFREGPDIAMRKLRTVLAAPPGVAPLDLHQSLSWNRTLRITPPPERARASALPLRSATHKDGVIESIKK